MNPWLRRTISISIISLAWLVWVSLFLIILGFSLSWDLRNRKPLVITRFAIFFLWFLTCELLGVIASLLAWLFTAGGLARQTFFRLNFALQRAWGGALFWGIVRIFNIQLRITGAQALSPGNLVVLARHVSSADSLLPTVLISRVYKTHLRFVMKDSLLWDPCLDIVGNRLPNSFIKRGKETRTQAVEQIHQLFDQLGEQEGVVLFPEGTRFTVSKREKILQRLKESGEDEAYSQGSALKNVLPPRRAGALAALNSNPGADVVFLAHTGLETVHDLQGLSSGSLVGKTIQINLWRIPFKEIPTTDEARMQWLWQQWSNIDQWIQQHSESS